MSPKMPELPEPHFFTAGSPADAYTADQMRAYALQVAEECARVCEEARDRALAQQKTDLPPWDRENSLGNVFLRHHAVAHDSDAAAIRERFTSPASPAAPE